MCAEELDELLLRRRRLVRVEAGGSRQEPRTAEGLRVLEAELAQRAHLLAAPLRRALGELDPAGLAVRGRWLLAEVDGLLGADRTHQPLFADFPDSTPVGAAHSLYTRVIRHHLSARPEQPCMACGDPGPEVRMLRGCGHLLCSDCWWGDARHYCCADCCQWYRCPLCEWLHTTDAPTSPWWPAEPVEPADAATTAGREPEVLRVLDLTDSPDRDGTRELATLLARRTPLSPEDADDLQVLLDHFARRADPGAPTWLPERVPLRENRALALDALLRCSSVGEATPLLRTHLDTATDVLRLLWVRSGARPDLLERPARLVAVPRPLRRVLCGVLDGLPLPYLVEDLFRHRQAWLRVGEVLHPFERYRDHPRLALAFATLRGTAPGADTGLGRELLRHAEESGDAVRLVGGRLRPVTWGGRVEQALAALDTDTAARLLGRRPGELLRRLDALLVRATLGEDTVPDPVLDALGRALPRVEPGPLLSALGALRRRERSSSFGGSRVVLPRGRVARPVAVPDQRLPMAPDVARDVRYLLESEVLDRLASRHDGAEPYQLAVLDVGLTEVPLPSGERTESASLVRIPRGTVLPLPGSQRLRLFLHWTQPRGVRVDLDLSVALYDEEWRFVGLCDYTRLEYGGGAALHSGDLTSAPAPHGATEYVDLHLAGLRHTVRHLVPVVFSYNDVPFGELPDAFTGFMPLPEEHAGERGGLRRRTRKRRRPALPPSQYDPKRVRQRCDLDGDAEIHVPMVVDLGTGRAHWTDVALPGHGTGHNVWRYHRRLGDLGRNLLASFTEGGRPTLWDLAVAHAAARTEAGAPVLVRAGSRWLTFRREEGESLARFARRVDAAGAVPVVDDPGGTDGPPAELAGAGRVFAALVHADLPALPEDARGVCYRLFPGPSERRGLIPATPGDLVAELAPRGAVDGVLR
ncbi:MXAN_6230/SCO0854 family RING domain-containing protein [Streptomyces sp. NPDC005438]|uniref:MXAN_6230/SCO0854 family RING domain-containing protein n=1 Tax=Streptomyces sp. NPDC005438 TaxID=3156880 RepID=UPI0033A74824